MRAAAAGARRIAAMCSAALLDVRSDAEVVRPRRSGAPD